LLALLLTYPNKAPIAECIQSLHPGMAADDIIVDCLQGAWKTQAIDTALDGSGVAILRALLRGERGQRLLAALREEFDVPATSERRILQAARQIAQVELFKPLFA
jgi:hypothetical protein